MARQTRCFECGEPAALLCDFIFGAEVAGFFEESTYASAAKCGRLDDWNFHGGRLPYASYDSALFTCDRPLCEACTTKMQPMFIEGDEREIFIGDLCKEHATAERPFRLYTKSQAKAIQRRLLFKIAI